MMGISYVIFEKQLNHCSFLLVCFFLSFLCISWWQLHSSTCQAKTLGLIFDFFLPYPMSNISANFVCTFFTIHSGSNCFLPPPLLSPWPQATIIFHLDNLISFLRGLLASVFAQLQVIIPIVVSMIFLKMLVNFCFWEDGVDVLFPVPPSKYN